MSQPTPITDGSDLEVIYGEFRDRDVVKEFVRAMRSANMSGTLYIGYPVLAIDDERVEFDGVLVSPDRGVVVFDLYSFQGSNQGEPSTIPRAVVMRLEQLYAALYNKLNFFRELRRGRELIVDIFTVAIHPIRSTFVQEDASLLISLDRLTDMPFSVEEKRLDDMGLQHLNAAIQRISRIVPSKKRVNVSRSNSMGAAIKAIEAQIANLDLWQKRGSIEYVNGPQRIRGLAGSGKTVVLALKASYLHVKRPDWNIVVTFNTRSLYQQFENLITRFVYAQVEDKPDWNKLRIMHAWGDLQRPGVYSEAAKRVDRQFLDFGTAARMFGRAAALDGACGDVLKALNGGSLNVYDAILMDEAQDLPLSFFRLAYRLTRDPKRIVWAYDDLQNLGDYQMPGEKELFGSDERGEPIVQLVNEVDEPQQDIVLPRCYRNPPWTLVTAHGVGFGTARERLVQMFPDPSIWRRLGYRVQNGTLDFDNDVTVERDPRSVPDFFAKFLNAGASLQVKQFPTRASQFEWVTQEIKRLLDTEELEETDLLVVIPDVYTSKSVGALFVRALQTAGVEGHVVGVSSSRDVLFVDGSIAVTHIYRAKGNEAPVVFILDANFCEGSNDTKKRRNILFTAITRSRAWVYVCGVGEPMRRLEREIDSIKELNYRLSFHYPKRDEIDSLSVSVPEDERAPRPRGSRRQTMEEVITRNWDALPREVQQELEDVMGTGS